jgi:hypothetical protein
MPIAAFTNPIAVVGAPVGFFGPVVVLAAFPIGGGTPPDPGVGYAS